MEMKMKKTIIAAALIFCLSAAEAKADGNISVFNGYQPFSPARITPGLCGEALQKNPAYLSFVPENNIQFGLGASMTKEPTAFKYFGLMAPNLSIAGAEEKIAFGDTEYNYIMKMIQISGSYEAKVFKHLVAFGGSINILSDSLKPDSVENVDNYTLAFDLGVYGKVYEGVNVSFVAKNLFGGPESFLKGSMTLKPDVDMGVEYVSANQGFRGGLSYSTTASLKDTGGELSLGIYNYFADKNLYIKFGFDKLINTAGRDDDILTAGCGTRFMPRVTEIKFDIKSRSTNSIKDFLYSLFYNTQVEFSVSANLGTIPTKDLYLFSLKKFF